MSTPAATPDPLGGQIKIIGVVFIILPFIAGGLRFWARSLIKARYAMDDWLILPAIIFNTVTGIAIIECVVQGGLGEFLPQPKDANGVPIWTDRNRNDAIWRYVIEIFTVLTIGCTKLSLLFLYKRVLIIHWFCILVNVWIALIVGWTISFSLLFMFQCTPVSTFWSGFDSLLEQHCVDQFMMFPALAISDLISDILIVLFPLPVLWKLQLPLKTKLAVVGIFLLGGLVCAAGSIRLAYFVDAINDYGPINAEETGTIYWTFLEAAIAIIGACLPALRPLFVKRSEENSDTASTEKYTWLRKKTSHSHNVGSFSHIQSAENRGQDTTTSFATTVHVGKIKAVDSYPELQDEYRGIKAETTWNNTYDGHAH